jgi:hypothetical protein
MVTTKFADEDVVCTLSADARSRHGAVWFAEGVCVTVTFDVGTVVDVVPGVVQPARDSASTEAAVSDLSLMFRTVVADDLRHSKQNYLKQPKKIHTAP